MICMGGRWGISGSAGARPEFSDQVWPTNTAQALLYASALLWLVPEEVLVLGKFLAGGLG